MTAPPTLLERLRTPEPGDHAADRAWQWLGAHGLPRSRDEAWRYTPVEEIVGRLEVSTPASSSAAPLRRSIIDDLAGDHGGARLVFVNGIYAPTLSDVDASSGLWCGPLSDAPAGWLATTSADAVDPDDGFVALNRAVAPDAAVVLADAGVAVEPPVHVVHVAVPSADGRITRLQPRTIVDAGAGSRLSIIETFCGGLPGATLTNAATTIRVRRGASVAHHRIQLESRGAVHVGHTAVEQEAESEVRATSVMLGGEIARSAIHVHLAGDHARSDLAGLYLPTGDQRHDNVITVDHAASHCTSRQRFKGIVDGHARGSFSGHVVVRPGTAGTDASQSNPNLVLTPTAQADTRPWLEILADDVRCTHGATVGRLDDDALFYLRSRGIPLARARAMLVEAFAAEVTDAIVPASLRDHVAVAIARAGRGADR